MKNKINVRTVALISGFSVFALALISALVMLFIQNKEQKIALDNMYERSFFELSDASMSLEMNLSKMLVAYDDEQTSVIAMDVYKNSESALDALTRLPLQRVNVADTEKFFNQVADFSLSFNKNLAYNLDSEIYKERLEDLYVTAREINQRLIQENEELQESNFNFIAMMKKRSKKDREEEVADNSQSQSRYQSVEYPELIYDGPFSDSTGTRSFKALESLEEVTFERACDILREKLPFSISSFALDGESGSMAPSYVINLSTNVGQAYCVVSKKGGVILTLCLNRDGITPALSEESATIKAKEYAEKLGFDVEPVWYNQSEGIAVVNFAPVKDDITYYTDLVKIKVALDDGGLLGAETTGYCMNHSKREFGIVLSKEEALSKLPSKLTVKSVRLAVVPYMEKCALTYEIAAEYKGLDYFIYVDASTGKQINIMRVINDEQGRMTY